MLSFLNFCADFVSNLTLRENEGFFCAKKNCTWIRGRNRERIFSLFFVVLDDENLEGSI